MKSMPAPLAYLSTWTTYGSWLPGDSRGWVEKGNPGIRSPDAERFAAANQQLIGSPVTLDSEQRCIVQEILQSVCAFRGWILHAINVRSNHVHVVVTADSPPETVMSQFKAWSSRRLNEREAKERRASEQRRRWWTRHGSTKWINDEDYLKNAIRYVQERQ